MVKTSILSYNLSKSHNQDLSNLFHYFTLNDPDMQKHPSSLAALAELFSGVGGNFVKGSRCCVGIVVESTKVKIVLTYNSIF